LAVFIAGIALIEVIDNFSLVSGVRFIVGMMGIECQPVAILWAGLHVPKGLFKV